MNNIEIVNKLIGNIDPIGETNTDNDRFENLKRMCELASDIITNINHVYTSNRHSNEFSVKRASDFARSFIDNNILD